MARHVKIALAVMSVSAFAFLNAGRADAVLVYEFIQQGNNVALSISGSLSGLPKGQSTTINPAPGGIDPARAAIRTGNSASTQGIFYGISGGRNFGTGGFLPFLPPSSYSGDIATLSGGAFLVLPASYVQGLPINGSGSFLNRTLSSLGLSSTSSLLGTWAVGSDSIEVWAGRKPRASSSVPGPLPVLGAGAAYAYSRRLRSRLRGARPALHS